MTRREQIESAYKLTGGLACAFDSMRTYAAEVNL